MDKKTFCKFVASEEKRQIAICGNSEYFCCEREAEFYKECSGIATEILKRLASSKKADKFISKLKTRSIYYKTGIRIGDDFEWHKLEMFFVTGDNLHDTIKINSDIHEKECYYHVIGPESFWSCHDLDSLIEYLENLPYNGISFILKHKDKETLLEEKASKKPIISMKLKKILKRVNKKIQKEPYSWHISDTISLSKKECKKKGFLFTRSLSFLRKYITTFTPIKYYSELQYTEYGEYTYLRIFFGYKRYKYIEVYMHHEANNEKEISQRWGILNYMSDDKGEFASLNELKAYIEKNYEKYGLYLV